MLLATAVAVLAALAGYPLYVSPATDPLPTRQAPADAVLALGGDPETARFAQKVVDRGLARHLVLSDPYGLDDNPVTHICRAATTNADPAVTCFSPDPATTRGEAEKLARLAASGGWRQVVVVAPVYHITRARMIVRRCYQGQLAMVSAPTRAPWSLWIYMYGYQTAGFVKAFLHDGC
jgi:uncharacterized SAM-binding protein YcdF (DUF218 family)